ncbi:MAG: 4Fe-4S binding protein [Candidatus Methanospirareceae archaeon]
MPAVIDKEKCDGCGTCVEECPVEAISLVEEGGEKYATVNAEECTECETCIDVCPNEAISMEEES